MPDIPTQSPASETTETPGASLKLFHKEARTFSLPNGQTQWETRCGLLMDNALDLVHSHEDMIRAALNPHVLLRGQVPCMDCMNDHEKAKIVDQLLDDPRTRADTLRAMDRTNPGDPHVELALAYETNPEFREWLNAYTFNATQKQEAQEQAEENKA